MGNRAVISVGTTDNDIGIYLHWNGGIESVVAFLDAAKRYGVRDPNGDPCYAMARLAQIVGNFFGGTLSLGIGRLGQLDRDNGDNGWYIIGKDWEIVERRFAGNHPDLTCEVDPAMAAEIDKRNTAHFAEQT